MIVSLDTLLKTGILGDLLPGQSKEEVQQFLGPPDDWGGTSRKYPQPSIFVYGTVELYFDHQKPQCLTGLFWEAGDKGEFRLPPMCEIADWVFTPDWTFLQVEDYLNELGLLREYQDPPASSVDPTLWIDLESGVHISFEDGKIYGVGMSYPY